VKVPKGVFEGLNLDSSAAFKKELKIPVIVTGGFQTASVIRNAITSGQCDAVTMARTLLANPTLPKMFKDGMDKAPKPCTYCNLCFGQVIENPLGCYDVSRYNGDYDAMIKEVMSIFRDK